MQQTLCSRCEQLDNTPACFTGSEAVPATGKPVLVLGKLSRRIKCNMCRFFFEFSPRYKRKHRLHVRLFDQMRPNILSPNISTLMNLPRTRFLSVLRENQRLQYDYSVQEEATQSGVVVYLPKDHSVLEPVPVRSVDTATVDFALLGSLIGRCQESHNLCNQVECQYNLPYIYLINCIEGSVVREHPNQSYLALSYVWGEPTSQACPQTALQEEFPDAQFSITGAPLTVQDAIRAVRNMGRRYLWVDKYCINQAESSEKKMMLQNMDQIYRNAEATIVAMHGKNDAAGLPGVSQVARIPQPKFRLTHGCLLSSCPPIRTLIQKSIWATRGWTYQEARLSRRCLFFTEHQVYFTCLETTASEAVPSESQSCWISWLLNRSRLDATLFVPDTSIAKGFYSDRLAYSQRLLTHESDILNAFRGILSHSGLVTFWGVPITPSKAAMDPHIGFALGFLWTRRPTWSISRHLKPLREQPRTRRANFPTWSWTSVTGEIFNEGYEEQSVFGKYLEADSQVSIQSDAYIRFSIYAEGELIPLHEAMQRYSVVLPEDSPILVVEGDVVRLTLLNRTHSYRVWGCEQLSLRFWAAYDLDEDTATGSSQGGNSSPTEEALILVDWRDGQRSTRKRFVMLLLKWVEDGRAERRGLLSHYKDEYDTEALKEIPRTRKTFILQ